jgi:hypothetical protein
VFSKTLIQVWLHVRQAAREASAMYRVFALLLPYWRLRLKRRRPGMCSSRSSSASHFAMTCSSLLAGFVQKAQTRATTARRMYFVKPS